jgi:hypothetical protein
MRAEPAHYFPTALYLGADEIEVEWENLGAEPFTEAFLGQTIEQRRRNLVRWPRRVTGLTALAALVKERPGLYPSGLIFHMSRCGSTLISRMLASLEGSIVVAEPAILNLALAAERPYLTEEVRDSLVRNLVSALAQRRSTRDTYFFIKHTSADILQAERMLRCFPDVKWIFVHRDPIEVAVSLIEKPNGWLHNKQAGYPLKLTRFTTEELTAMPKEEYCAVMLSSFLEAALRVCDERCLILDYREPLDVVPDRVAKHFGIEPSAAERERMLNVAATYSKDNSASQRFVDDSARKQSTASPELRAAIDRHTAATYNALTKIAASQS